MTTRLTDALALLAVVTLVGVCSAFNSIDLADILRGRQRVTQKRNMDGNPCPEPEKPFPCKNSATCIPMAYVCDDNYDCEDEYDEDDQLCTAATRPPVEAITHFLDNEKDWVKPDIFGDKSIAKIAHALVVSRTVGDFKRRVGLNKSQEKNLRIVLKSVTQGNEKALQKMGMPEQAWDEVNYFISKLIKSGFDS